MECGDRYTAMRFINVPLLLIFIALINYNVATQSYFPEFMAGI